MEISTGEKQKGSGSVRQYYADLAQYQFLLVGYDQELESAAQAVAVAHHGSHLDEMRRKRNGKLYGNNFARLQLTAESRPDAILAKFVGSAPACGRQAFAKHRHLNAHVKTMTRETPQPPLSFSYRLCVVAQSSFSISDLSFQPQLAIVLEPKGGPQRHQSPCTNELAFGRAERPPHCCDCAFFFSCLLWQTVLETAFGGGSRVKLRKDT
jgi:hypothetical protein